MFFFYLVSNKPYFCTSIYLRCMEPRVKLLYQNLRPFLFSFLFSFSGCCSTKVKKKILFFNLIDATRVSNLSMMFSSSLIYTVFKFFITLTRYFFFFSFFLVWFTWNKWIIFFRWNFSSFTFTVHAQNERVKLTLNDSSFSAYQTTKRIAALTVMGAFNNRNTIFNKNTDIYLLVNEI